MVVRCIDSGDMLVTRRFIIAHRGASAHAPENTLLSFEKAWHYGADMIELDVHETADGHLVCIHDATIDRTTNGTGAVSSLTLNEIQKFDAGMGQQIPLLQDVLKFSKGKIQVNIELKISGVEERISNIVSNLDMINDVIISSFLHLSLSVIKEISDRIRIAILVQNEIENLPSYAHEIGAYAINPAKELTSALLITNSHEFDIKVFPWTVNDEETMLRLLDVGVDGLITDYPDIGVNLVKKRSS